MKLSLVVPVYNEEAAIPLFYDAVRSYEFFKSKEVEIVFISDGSTDKTEEIVLSLAKKDPLVMPLFFMRNFGKEPALMAGLTYATGDAVIPIDVDLQDPIEVIEELVKKWQEGADVVLAKRIDRSTDSFLKRKTAAWFYKVQNFLSDLHIEENVGDFRLLDRKIVDEIKNISERNLFMKGILSWVGGKVAIVPYTRKERSAGDSKFNFRKLWNLAMEGITSFSTALLRVWTYIGVMVASVAFLYGLYRIISKFMFGNNVPGYSSMMVAIVFLGGIQLIGIGILGEYIGRIYIETKKRPRYVLKHIDTLLK